MEHAIMGAHDGPFGRRSWPVGEELLDLKAEVRERFVEHAQEANDVVAAAGLAACATSSASAAHGSALLSRSLTAAMCFRITSLASGIISPSRLTVRVSHMFAGRPGTAPPSATTQ